MSLAEIVRMYRLHNRREAHEELDCFRSMGNLQDVIARAAMATDRFGRRHLHHRRRKRAELEAGRAKLLSHQQALGDAKSFDELHSVIAKLILPIKGLKELYIYDTAQWIGAWLGHPPERVYLHAGTRTGALALGLGKGKESIDP